MAPGTIDSFLLRALSTRIIGIRPKEISAIFSVNDEMAMLTSPPVMVPMLRMTDARTEEDTVFSTAVIAPMHAKNMV